MGNVTASSSFTMEYHCVDLNTLFEMEYINLDYQQNFPF